MLDLAEDAWLPLAPAWAQLLSRTALDGYHLSQCMLLLYTQVCMIHVYLSRQNLCISSVQKAFQLAVLFMQAGRTFQIRYLLGALQLS